MTCGDDNTKFFQAFTKGRKQQNTIWELRNSADEPVTTFEGMVEISKAYLKNIFKVDQQAKITEVIHTTCFFPERISKEDKSSLMEEVSEEELKTILHSF